VSGSAFTYLAYLSAVTIGNKLDGRWKNVRVKNMTVFYDVLHRKHKIL